MKLKLNLQLFDDGEGTPPAATTETVSENTDGANGLPSGEETPKQPFKTFSTQEEYQADFDTIFAKRHRDYGELKNNHDNYKNIADKAQTYFKSENMDELLATLDEETLQELADEEGMTPNEYRLHMENEQLKQVPIQQEQNKIIEGWRAEEAELQKSNPDFDLSAEMDNELFGAFVRSGKSLKESYNAIHHEEIMAKGIETAKKNMLESIKSGSFRITENGSNGIPGSSKPSTADTKEKRAELAKRAERKEEVFL